MQPITPFLWFDNQAEEAINFYTSIFKDAKVVSLNRGPGNQVMSGTFELTGQRFMALNGGPEFKFSEAISFFVSVETQEEIDELWQKLTADGGQESQCGWLKDRFGLSWQIIPTVFGKMLGDSNREKANRAMQAMLQMKKIDIRGLEKAFNGA